MPTSPFNNRGGLGFVLETEARAWSFNGGAAQFIFLSQSCFQESR